MRTKIQLDAHKDRNLTPGDINVLLCSLLEHRGKQEEI